MPKKLTMAQIYTLRRIKSGTKYQLDGRKKKGRELRYNVFSRVYEGMNCSSIPVLFRSGLIKFTTDTKVADSLFHSVELTDAGRQMLEESKER